MMNNNVSSLWCYRRENKEVGCSFVTATILEEVLNKILNQLFEALAIYKSMGCKNSLKSLVLPKGD